jgi:uncharacterized protein
MLDIAVRIAEELKVNERQTAAAIALLDEGATVPFIARYRKEKTGALDDTQLRTLEERLRYLREMADRRDVIINSITEQGKLTEDLKSAILAADTKTSLEDLYLPYKPKRRTRAQIAIEAGLEPLASSLFQDPNRDPISEAQAFLSVEQNIETPEQALEGARQILMEQFSENAELVGQLREYLWLHGKITSTVLKNKEQEGQKFADYFEYEEAINKIPSHRALALFRGRQEGILSMKLDVAVPEGKEHPCEKLIRDAYGFKKCGRAGDAWLAETFSWSWKVKIHMHIEADLKMRLREAAEEEGIKVFSTNLSALLLAAPAGARATLGLDPGLRTGVKVAVVDATGKHVDHATIYPHVPKRQWDKSIATLVDLIKKHDVSLISIGNGTGSRETDKLAADVIKQLPDRALEKLMVSEAGASVYSASETAAKEFPNLDVSIRGAVSIARRLQDPLAELVKIEPKAIGVGQYQHDVNQSQLGRSLEAVVEDCVNAVGVDVNIASAALLSRVSGLNATLAANLVDYRDNHGAFANRKQFLSVPRLGPKAFEQAAGFLRIRSGDNPLDASAVHPEAYPIVQSIANNEAKLIEKIIGDSSFLKSIRPEKYTDDTFGLPTIIDIITELEKPGRDPRPEFKTAEFMEGVEKISDLVKDMQLEGVVTNVTNFGAFVDIGVHQDGLVHISQLADRFVKNPHDVVKAGDLVKVRVVEVDERRKRIALTMKQAQTATREKPKKPNKKSPKQEFSKKPRVPQRDTAMAAAFRKAKD